MLDAVDKDIFAFGRDLKLMDRLSLSTLNTHAFFHFFSTCWCTGFVAHNINLYRLAGQLIAGRRLFQCAGIACRISGIAIP